MKKSQKKHADGLSTRVRFPEDEQRLPWLPMLLDAYAIADTGVAVAVREEGKKRGKKLACGKGCGNCCDHQKDLPLYPHELVGIYWYVSEKAVPSIRSALRDRLAKHAAGSGCPFLIDHACSVHPLRPLGCRQFNVFTAPCKPGEDPYFTRRDDVLTPLPEYTDRVFGAVFPLYNIKQAVDTAQSLRLVRAQIMNLLAFDWNKLAAIIDQTVSRKS